MDDNFVASKSLAAALTGTGNGSHPEAKKTPSVISQHLREELIRILKAGDAKNEGAFTVAVAAQIEKFAVAAREILMTEDLAQKDLASLMMMRRHHGGPYLGGSLVGDSIMPMPYINNENFGVQAIRQVVDAIRTIGESPAKLVEALAAARKNNLTDVVALLEKKLGISTAESEDAATEVATLPDGRPIPTLPDGRPLQ